MFEMIIFVHKYSQFIAISNYTRVQLMLKLDINMRPRDAQC